MNPPLNCSELASPSYLNFGVSLFILLGILVSYLPQHYRIISRHSSEGISPYFVLLGTTSGTFAFANILSLPASRTVLACCKEVSGFSCFANILGIAQIGIQWSCFVVILLLFLLFFPRATPLAPPHSPKSSPSYRTALFVVVTCIVHLIVVLILSFIFIYRFPRYLQQWANILGVLGTILAAIQFLPQIYTTWRLQAVRSLSIPMMCIQTPGSFVWVASLATRLGTAGWSTWGIYLVTGVLQGFLLVMAISFEIRDRKMSKKDSVAGTSDSYDSGIERDGQTREERPPDYEHTRLLGNER